MVLRDSSNKIVQINRYKVLSQLGKSGFGAIYHVVDKEDGTKEYILKLVDKRYTLYRVSRESEG